MKNRVLPLKLSLILICISFLIIIGVMIINWGPWVKQKGVDTKEVDAWEVDKVRYDLPAYPSPQEELVFSPEERKSADVKVDRPTRPEGDSEVQGRSISQPTSQEPETSSSEGVSTSEEDYSKYDEEMNQWIPLDTIGIPQFETSPDGFTYKPTEEDKRRMEELYAEVREMMKKGIITHERKEGYIPVEVDPGEETVYVHPDYLDRYLDMLEEGRAIYERGKRPVTDPYSGFYITPAIVKFFPDGTKLEYYRRVDGALIRCVEKPDGTIQRWVIGWADLSEYPQDTIEAIKRCWREE